MPLPRPLQVALPYLVAVLAVVVTLLARVLLWSTLGGNVPFMLFFLAIMVAAWHGGLGPGLLATILSLLAADYFFIEPRYSFGVNDHVDILALGLFAVVGMSIAILSGSLHSSRLRYEMTAGESLKHQEARSQLAAIVESSDDAIIGTTLDSVIVTWNAGAEKLYGYSAAEVTGRSVSILYPPRQYDEEVQIIERITNGERVHHYETVRKSKSGNLLDVSLSVSPIKDAAAKIIGFSKIARDITDRKRLEAALAKRAQELEELNRSKDEFLATLSHELRTPMTSILGWVRMIRMGWLDDDQVALGMETIERQARAEVTLIDDLLDVSRIITGRLSLEVRPVDLMPIIDVAAKSVQPAATAKNISLRLHLTPCVVRADPERLQQVLWNLLSNAIKFTPDGGVVTVSLRGSGGRAEITVSDTGQGIAQAFLPSVFDRFRQADSSSTRSHGGLGLGLAIVRHLVELHGGTVCAASKGEGQGSTFTVSLPLYQQKNSTPEPRPVSVPTACSLPGCEVLVVEDDPDTLTLLAMVLRRGGARVLTAGSAKEALEMLEGTAPHVLISDIGMPEMDGYELIRRVRERYPAGQLPAVALTAYTREEDRRAAFAAGYQEHLSKPIEPERLCHLIAEMCAMP